jgi:hypothetical protein
MHRSVHDVVSCMTSSLEVLKCVRGESNPRLSRGRGLCYHYTTNAPWITAGTTKNRFPGAKRSLARPGRMRIWFTVNSMEAAERVVENRCDLKGTCSTVYDVLSPKERQQHARLWPHFLAAQAAGKKAKFNRARLYVDKLEVLAPPDGVGA